MRLLTFTQGGYTRAGFAVGDQVVDLAGASRALASRGTAAPLPDSLIYLLDGGDEALSAAREIERRAAEEVRNNRQVVGPNGERLVFNRAEVQFQAPIQRPGKIICLGQNYAEHAREGGSEPPKFPMFFAKFANALIGNGSPIVLSNESNQIDYEAELAFVIGKPAKRVGLDQAMDYVAGYMNLNDISARDLQRETSQFFRGKGGDTWAPCGPYLVTKDEVPSPGKLRIRSILNGEVMQDSNTEQLIFNIPYLVYHLSKTVTLEPGDIISTGTPSGVGAHRNPPVFLKPGDVIKVEVEGLGTLENPCAGE
ncbi:MAG TPA: fumarylacetoacetate hydrolase family protein [Chloroflexota bacterium]|nr:fumarylacetoacetate hydrolase family protein [Chloroflexota bacterium]